MAAGAARDIPDPAQTRELDHNLAWMRGNRREMRISAAAAAAAASVAASSAAAVPIPAYTPPLPRPTHTPRPNEGSESGRPIRKKVSPLVVGSVALAVASRLPQVDASQVYTCSADEFNNEHCTMLSSDNDFSFDMAIDGRLGSVHSYFDFQTICQYGRALLA